MIGLALLLRERSKVDSRAEHAPDRTTYTAFVRPTMLCIFLVIVLCAIHMCVHVEGAMCMCIIWVTICLALNLKQFLSLSLHFISPSSHPLRLPSPLIPLGFPTYTNNTRLTFQEDISDCNVYTFSVTAMTDTLNGSASMVNETLPICTQVYICCISRKLVN